jgi:hypothetical protein
MGDLRGFRGLRGSRGFRGSRQKLLNLLNLLDLLNLFVLPKSMQGRLNVWYNLLCVEIKRADQ